jgi:Flp pilus assembly protein TadG
MFFCHFKSEVSSMQVRHREDGAVLVEFALVLVPLLLLAFGFLQLGIAMNAKIDATHLTAEGARYIAVNQKPDPDLSLPDYIRSRGDTSDLKEKAEICVEYPSNPETSTSGQVGDPVRVTLTYQYGPLVPLVGDSLPGDPTTLDVESEATMRLEAIPDKIPAGCSTPQGT